MRLFLLPLILSLSGCAGLSTMLAPSALPLEQAAVAAAVFTTISANHASPTEQAARAARVITVAKAILAADTGANMALADVEIIVNSRIQSLGLPPAELLLAQLLTASLGQAVQAQLALTTKGAISPDTQIAIAAVCKWVIMDAGGSV